MEMRAMLFLLLALAMLFITQDAQASHEEWLFDHLTMQGKFYILPSSAISGPRRPWHTDAQAPPPSIFSSVVQVASFQGNQLLQSGSGFIIQTSGLVLTSSHIIHNVSSVGTACQGISTSVAADRLILLVTEKGENSPAVPRYLASVIKDHPDLDLALLQMKPYFIKKLAPQTGTLLRIDKFELAVFYLLMRILAIGHLPHMHRL
jgi:S1-C subfamily serine protease